MTEDRQKRTDELNERLREAGWKIDPFADVRRGKSLFQMQPEDWLVPIDEQEPHP